jgi:thioredoxin-dependent peroxiredoxin
MELKTADEAPDFSLPDQDGRTRRLSDYRGRWVLVYFYPRDDTPGCTTEACGIRDTWGEFERRGLTVLGISTDTVASHKKFEAKHSLPFTLLADEQKEVVKAYGVWAPKKLAGREFLGTKRTSFLIDPEGKIAKVYPKVKPGEHADEILADHERLAG